MTRVLYAMLGTRPDISYAVTMVSKFSSNPGLPHWGAVKRISRYLAGTIDLRLTFGGEEKALTVGFADAGGSMGEGRHALTGNAYPMAALYPGVRKGKRSSPSQQPRASTWQPRTPQRRVSGHHADLQPIL